MRKLNGVEVQTVRRGQRCADRTMHRWDGRPDLVAGGGGRGEGRLFQERWTLSLYIEPMRFLFHILKMILVKVFRGHPVRTSDPSFCSPHETRGKPSPHEWHLDFGEDRTQLGSERRRLFVEGGVPFIPPRTAFLAIWFDLYQNLWFRE
ncbi:hypothetical protein J6590_032000 [Homalodisca vitripennis]|nr:hypothetical protein J6590_032000 [Homalodisca vitripennis]